MPFEIDILSVGNADAIILRYLDEQGAEYVILIDAGKTKAHGKQVVEHVKKYSQQQYIDLAISTHPDKDHIGGFFFVVDNIYISEFWIHDPQVHKDGNDKVNKSLQKSDAFEISKSLNYVVESLNQSKSLIELIDEKEIDRYEPLEGRTHYAVPIEVLGPSPDYYKQKLHKFRDVKLLYESTVALEKAEISLEDWIDKLKRFDKMQDRSNENNSSVIMLFMADDRKVLFTSDAGPEALNLVVEKYDLTKLDFLDVPHHGSENNITSKIMDVFSPKTAFISCGDDYPSETLVKYLKGKKTKVFSTKTSGNLRHRVKLPARTDWSQAKPL